MSHPPAIHEPTRPAALVVVGASAGGVEALRTLVARLAPDLDTAVLVVLHVPRGASSALPAILTRSGNLPAAHARNGELLTRGRILVAPADHHLLVVDGRVRLSHGPSENGHRPAVDPLFRSAARAWGRRTLGIVLSGSRDDGTAGAAAIAARGGGVIVQDPGEALHGSMPRTAAEYVPSALVLPAASIGTAVAEWAEAIASEKQDMNDDDSDLLAMETAVANMADITTDELGGEPAGFGCPSCHGALYELPGVPAPRFRCRVGHAWSPESLLDQQGAALEGALWMALRSLEEKAALSRRMAQAARQRGSGWVAERFDEAGVENENASRTIRNLIQRLADLYRTHDPE